MISKKSVSVLDVANDQTTLSKEGAQNVQLKANNNYDSTVGNKEATGKGLNKQIADQTNTPPNMVQNAKTAKGLYIIYRGIYYEVPLAILTEENLI